MKHIYVNFKRFDVPKEMGGVNSLAGLSEWAKTIISQTQQELVQYNNSEFVMFFPEAHILSAKAELKVDVLKLGCQGVHYEDIAKGGNFGAFTTNKPAAAAKALGCSHVLIGHCEERKDKMNIMLEVGANNAEAAKTVNRLLNKEIKLTIAQGMKVLYCIGESAEQQEKWQEVLGEQLSIGLNGVDKNQVVIAYEPIWSIGPGKTPADKPYIEKIAKFVKKYTGNMDIVYGGGLKQENAEMLASIDDIDGGLIALTRFTDDIGFYPEEYLDIVKLYLANRKD